MGDLMSKNKLFKIADIVVFAALMAVTFLSFSDKSVAAKIDSAVLPEEINEGFYEVINSRLIVEGGDSEAEPSVSRYSFLKGALDGEIVTADDWKVMSNNLEFQIQTDLAVMDFQDGTGVVVKKEDFPTGTYGTLNGTEIEGEGKTIDVSDYPSVMAAVKETENPEGKDLKDISDIYAYLKALKGTDYTILMAVCDEGTLSLNDKLVELLKRLGTRTDLNEKAEDNVYDKIHYRDSYYAVLSHGQSLDENVSHDKLSTSGKLPGGIEYTVDSAGYDTGESIASIRIAGEEYAVNQRGMNIVVYDENNHEVVDTVCFDTCDGLWCHR